MSSKALVPKAKQPKGKGPGRKGRKAQQLRLPRAPASRMGALCEQYCRSLVDPFNHTPPKVGWGCMVPSTIVTATYRTVINPNAYDVFYQLPCTSLSIFVLQTASTATLINTGSANSANQYAAFPVQFGQGRVLSMGMRMIPSIPMNQASGFLFAGAAAGSTFNQYGQQTVANVINATWVEAGNAANGVTVTGRPVDPNSFNFAKNVVTATAADTWGGANGGSLELPFTIPTVVYEPGLAGTSSSYVLEAVWHIEGLAAAQNGASSIMELFGLQGGGAETLSDYFPTPESAYKFVTEKLSAAVSFGVGGSAQAGLLQNAAEALGGWGGAALSGFAATAAGAGLAARYTIPALVSGKQRRMLLPR